METQKFIGYYRVSTRKQVNSTTNLSLGVEAQKNLVLAFINSMNGELISDFTEIESGKNNNRPLLAQAIQQAEKTGATLVISKLDRLSREVGFIFELKSRIERTGVKIRCLDMPEMNTLNLGILSTISQFEREQIASRTRLALQEKKKQGVKLGTPKNLTYADRLKGVKVRQENAKNNDRNRQATAIIISKRVEGLSFQKIADYLNELSFKTRRDKQFESMTVKLLFDRVV